MTTFKFITVLTLVLFFFLLMVALGMVFLRTWRLQKKSKEESRHFRQQLGTSFTLGGYLLEAHDEESVIMATMRTGNELLQADGCAFVPFNEWRQSLPALKYGNLPFLKDEDWQKRLLAPSTRQSCKLCESRRAGAGCILIQSPADSENVLCIPLRCGGREIGVINYFLSMQPELDEMQHIFLSEMVRMTDLALDSIRAREQEISALRHIQNPSVLKEDFSELLKHLLDDIRQALEVDLALAWIETEEGLPPPMILQSTYSSHHGTKFSMDHPSMLDGIWQTVSKSNKTLTLESVVLPNEIVREGAMKLLAVPVVWGEHAPLGMLLLGSEPGHKFTRRQLMLLRTVAGQVALLVQNGRLITHVEYQAMLDERTRLAREIHDGLAQTLAFLKLEAARMQTYLAQGDTDLIRKTLQNCYQTLSDAYLDARQAIDNLRRIPDEALGDWLQMTAAEFKTLTGVETDATSIQVTYPFPPTVKAQLVRIVQEALNNIRKHAQASRVSISALERDQELIIQVCDNGCGFAPEEKQPISQYGLRSMRERAEAIGANFQIVSAPGKGATVRLHIPIHERVSL